MFKVEIIGNVNGQFRELERLLDAATLKDIFAAVGRRAGAAAESVISPYPPPSGKPLALLYTRQRRDGTTYRSKFKTLRQQRKVFSLIASGRIPYRRTGQLGRSITSDLRDLSAAGVTVAVGTNVPRAALVIGTPEEGQSSYHTGTWTPLALDIQRGAPVITRAANDELVRQLTRYLKG